jgi:hypothetical protein
MALGIAGRACRYQVKFLALFARYANFCRRLHTMQCDSNPAPPRAPSPDASPGVTEVAGLDGFVLAGFQAKGFRFNVR